MQNLKNSELRYRRLFEAAQDGILILDAKTGMIEDVNPYLIKILGYSREEFVEKKLWEVGSFKDIKASKDAFEVLQDREYIRYEDLPLKTKDGRLIQVEFISNVYLVDGEKVIQCNIREITEHKRIVAALQANAKKYYDLINQSPDGYFIIELSGNILIVNNAMCKELEFSEKEFLSMSIWDIIPDQFLDQYKERLTRILRGESLKEAAEYMVRGKTGRQHYVEVLSAPRYAGGDIIGFQGIARDITARKRAEDALQASEAKFRVLVENLPTVVYINAVGDTTSTLYVSPQIETLLGYTPQEWLADPKFWMKSIHPEDRQLVLTQAAHTDQDNEPFEMEYRMIARDGRLVWVHDQVVLVKDLADQPKYWQGIMLDITERKLAEAAVIEGLQRFSQVWEATSDAMALSDPHGIVLAANPAYLDLYGYKLERVVGRSFAVIFPQEIQAQAVEQYKTVFASEVIPPTFESAIRRSDGSERIVESSVAFLTLTEQRIAMLSTIRDITERKQAEKALYESEDRFRNAFQYSAIGMALVSLEGKWLKVNSNICSILGYSEDELLVKTFQDNTHPDDLKRDLNYLNQLLAGEIKSYTMEKRYFHKEGRIIWALLAVALARDKMGVPLYFISQIKDITERKQAEEALRESAEQFRAWIENSLDVVTVVGLDGVIQYASPSYQNVLGYKPENMIGANTFDLLHPDDRDRVMEIFAQTIQKPENAASAEFRYRHRDGSWRVFEGLGRTYLDKHGQMVGLINSRDITERKNADETLRESEERYSSLFENMLNGFAYCQMIYDDKGSPQDFIYLKVNKAFETATGLKDVIGKKVSEAIPGSLESDSEVIKTYGRVSLSGIPEAFEVHLESLQMWISISVYSPQKEYFVAVFDVITERKRAEEIARETQARFEGVVSMAVEAIISIDENQRVILFNPGAEQVFGYTFEEALGMPLDEFLPPAVTKSHRHLVQNFGAMGDEVSRQMGKLREVQGRRKEGTLFPAEVNISKLTIKGYTIYTAIVRDITERKQADMGIRQRLSELEVLYQSGLALSQLVKPKAIAQKMIDLLDQIMDWHHTAIRLYHPESKTFELLAFTMPNQISQEEYSAIEKRLKTIQHDDQGLSGWAVQHAQAVRSNDLKNDPRYLVTLPGLQSGLYVPIKIAERVLGVISIESDKPNAFNEADERIVTTLSNQAAVAFDNASLFQSARQEIAERKKVEALLADERNQLALRVKERTAELSLSNADLARAVRARDEFLASMSHELRTPLTGILGFSETLQLKTYGELNERQFKAIKYIQESGRHLLDLINDILDLSKIDAGKLDLKFAPCALADVCQASIQLTKGIAQQKKQKVYYTPLPEPIILTADPRRLKQILVNLLSNAIKFTPENGELGLEVQVDEVGRRVRLTVWDKGIGIEPGDLLKLFKPFVQLDSSLAREFSGTGLGLSLAQRLTELHNGSIEVESIIGKGSRFTVILPWSP